MDSLLSIVQMPAGVPVGTLAIGPAGAVNAALLAAAILATTDPGSLPGSTRSGRSSRSRWPLPRATRRNDFRPPTRTRPSASSAAVSSAACPLWRRQARLPRPHPHARGGQPRVQVSAAVTLGDYEDAATLRRFAEAVDVITFEFENVSAEGLDLLASLRPVRPSPDVLRVSQDRVLEKSFLNAERRSDRALVRDRGPCGACRRPLRGSGFRVSSRRPA